MSQITFQQSFPQGIFKTYNHRPEIDFYKVHQIHSADLYPITVKDMESESRHHIEQIKADGLWCKWDQAKTLAIVTADCLPILLLGSQGLALVHAGWRGVQSGILLHSDLKKLGIYLAFIGPAISMKAYEVGEEFQQHFPASKNFHQLNGKLHFDLVAEASDQLRETFPRVVVENSGHCTYSERQFHSFRRDKTTLRNYHLFIPNPVRS